MFKEGQSNKFVTICQKCKTTIDPYDGYITLVERIWYGEKIMGWDAYHDRCKQKQKG
jgi:hypothetical protein